MSFRAYLAHQWEYLLAVALLLTASASAAFLAAWGRLDWAGLAVLCATGFWFCAIKFAEAADNRVLMAMFREQRAEALEE